MNENNKCAHERCVCMVMDDDEYCSEYCTSAGNQDITDIKCGCGHSGCE